MHSDMVVTLRTTTIGSGPEAGGPGLDRVFTAFGERITGPIDRNGYAGAWGYQSHDVSGASGGGGGSGSGSAVPFDFLHVGARYYDPSSGRFLQRDPIGIAGGMDVYVYVRSSPLAFVDPTGLFDTEKGAIGGAGGAAMGAKSGNPAYMLFCAAVGFIAGGYENGDAGRVADEAARAAERIVEEAIEAAKDEIDRRAKDNDRRLGKLPKEKKDPVFERDWREKAGLPPKHGG
jgi:RHS repeat-associated protein